MNSIAIPVVLWLGAMALGLAGALALEGRIRCYRLPRGISELAIVHEYDQAMATVQHEFSCFDWRAWQIIAGPEGAYATQEEMP